MSSGCFSCEPLSLNSLTESNFDWKSEANIDWKNDFKNESKSDWSDEDDDVTICGEPLSLSDYSDLFYRSFR
jgi:hypothetical protein